MHKFKPPVATKTPSTLADSTIGSNQATNSDKLKEAEAPKVYDNEKIAKSKEMMLR